jgi:hypothetical protein
MMTRFEALPVKQLPPATVAMIAFSGAIVIDLLPALLLACGYNAVVRVVSR